MVLANPNISGHIPKGFTYFKADKVRLALDVAASRDDRQAALGSGFFWAEAKAFDEGRWFDEQDRLRFGDQEEWQQLRDFKPDERELLQGGADLSPEVREYLQGLLDEVATAALKAGLSG